MPLRFAPARQPARSPVARALVRRAVERAANDDGEHRHEDMLGAALRHFAAHGLGAAQVAAEEAERAAAAGEGQESAWWLGVCRTLDRRLANRVAKRCAVPGTRAEERA